MCVRCRAWVSVSPVLSSAAVMCALVWTLHWALGAMGACMATAPTGGSVGTAGVAAADAGPGREGEPCGAVGMWQAAMLEI